jgi:predicted AAA+ superfamily ATPase
VIEDLISRFELQRNETYFWATHAGAKLDLLVMRHGRRTGFEIKRTAAPSLTRSMRAARDDLRLDRLYVVHAGEDSFPLGERVVAVPFTQIGSVEV